MARVGPLHSNAPTLYNATQLSGYSVGRKITISTSTRDKHAHLGLVGIKPRGCVLHP